LIWLTTEKKWRAPVNMAMDLLFS
jgi:hypothetical protein